MVVTQSERTRVFDIITMYRGKHSTHAVGQIKKDMKCGSIVAERLFRRLVGDGLVRVDQNCKIQIKGVDY